MIKVKEAIIVEGIYDKKKLQTVVEGTIIATNGFRIFKDTQMLGLIKTLAEQIGIVILTDSDRAGFLIRNHLKGCIDNRLIKHAYIPDVPGVEKRKKQPSKEGLLGVEGIDETTLAQVLRSSGCTIEGAVPFAEKQQITIQDLFDDGLSGTAESAKQRLALCTLLQLPGRLSTKALLEVLNRLLSYDQYKELVAVLAQDK